MTPEELKAHFRQRLAMRIRSLEGIFPEKQTMIHEHSLEELIDFLHKLSGAAGLYGFGYISACAKEAENQALGWQEGLAQGCMKMHSQTSIQATLSKQLKELHQMMLAENQAS